VIKTRYWRPGDNYLKSILDSTQRFLRNSDVLICSEKALSIAEGNVIDEGTATPGLPTKVLVALGMRFLWGRFLGILCHFKAETVRHLRSYPIHAGAAHKQIILRYAGLVQALKYGSEGGVDTSNVPFSYVCLPLKNPMEVAEHIRRAIHEKTGKTVTVIIADTDSTFSYRNFHFTSRPHPVQGIHSFGGAFSFVLGRALKLRQRATPLAVVGSEISVEEALNLVEIAHHARGYGAGRTVWDMGRRFGVDPSKVTWEMLEAVDHFPIVLIRRT